MTKIFLLIQGLGFGLFGLYCFFNPEFMMAGLGAPSMSGDGLYELRGIYGGVSIGGAMVILSGFFKQTMQRPALFFILAYTGGYALARVAALPLDGMPGSQFYPFIGYEVVSALIAAYLLKKTS